MEWDCTQDLSPLRWPLKWTRVWPCVAIFHQSGVSLHLHRVALLSASTELVQHMQGQILSCHNVMEARGITPIGIWDLAHNRPLPELSSPHPQVANTAFIPLPLHCVFEGTQAYLLFSVTLASPGSTHRTGKRKTNPAATCQISVSCFSPINKYWPSHLL